MTETATRELPSTAARPFELFTELLPAHPPASLSPVARRASAARGYPVRGHLVLPFERRQKTRQRARLSTGQEIGIQLLRGTVLRGGDRLRSAVGNVIEVVSAPEVVSTVPTRSLIDLARVAYHLGNRHVALEVGDGWVRYLADHVLDAMVDQLGLLVVRELEPFEPERGAYGEHGTPHAQANAPTHAHGAAHTPAGARSHAHATPPHTHAVAETDAQPGAHGVFRSDLHPHSHGYLLDLEHPHSHEP
jgi:urease accessory protein